MQEVILIVHILLAIVMVVLILLQRSEGGALGIGGGGGVGGLMSSRGAANLLTRTTGILAGLFFLTSIVLTVLSKGSTESKSVLDTATPPAQTQQAPAATGEKPTLDTALPKSAPEPSSGEALPAAPKSSSDEPQVPIAK
jgi:preprotein translocase subunit SecG